MNRKRGKAFADHECAAPAPHETDARKNARSPTTDLAVAGWGERGMCFARVPLDRQDHLIDLTALAVFVAKLDWPPLDFAAAWSLAADPALGLVVVVPTTTLDEEVVVVVVGVV
jgi:hypothetical protein